MADKAREWTDEQLEKLEKKISKEYKQAEKELTQKWNAYMEKGEARLSALEQAVSDAKKSGDKDLIKEAQDKLQKAKENYTLQNTHYKDMVDSVTMDIAKVNQQALSYINGQLPNIYATNYEQAKDILDDLPVSYSLHNKSTVMNMIDKGDVKLPKKKINISKDQRWNTKKINSSVLQGILQGEPMDKIAKRLLPIMDNNKVSAIRNARTLVTGAENRGRLDSYKELEDQGVILKKVWIATGDDRTRDWHLSMDGQEVDVDENFVDGNGNELEYPADPSAEPETVYNCRCSMRTHVVGFRKDDGSINYVDYEHEEGLHQQQIAEEIERRGVETESKNEIETISEENIINVAETNSQDDGTFAEKWYEELTDEQKDVIEWYVSGDGMEANNYLRERGYYSGGRDADDFLKNAINDLDNSIASYGGLKEDQVLYRSLDISDIIPNANERDIDNFVYGKDGKSGYWKGDKDQKDEAVKSLLNRTKDEYVDKGFMSTTRDKDIALEWGDFTGANNSVVLELDVPKGANGADLRGFDIAEDQQKEVLFARNSQYEIYDIKYEQGIIIFKGRMKI